MKLAHLSDLHLVALQGAVPWRLLNKRLTGYVNLRLVRAHRHRLDIGERVVRELVRHRPDHVVVTGDLTNLALEQEFDAAASFVRSQLGLDPQAVSLVPGNHDAYTRGAFRSGRFASRLGPYLSTDLPTATPAADEPRHPFPFVRLRGPIAIIGLDTGVPRPPLVAAGELGAKQLGRLRGLLHHPEVRARFPVVLQHHPPRAARSTLKQWLEGLRDAAAERAVLEELGAGMLLHGHLHRRTLARLATPNGQLLCIGSTSATLEHPAAQRRAGFNLYEFDSLGAVRSLRTFRIDEQQRGFVEGQLEQEGW